jgi:hypothetical protein
VAGWGAYAVISENKKRDIKWPISGYYYLDYELSARSATAILLDSLDFIMNHIHSFTYNTSNNICIISDNIEIISAVKTLNNDANSQSQADIIQMLQEYRIHYGVSFKLAKTSRDSHLINDALTLARTAHNVGVVIK